LVPPGWKLVTKISSEVSQTREGLLGAPAPRPSGRRFAAFEFAVLQIRRTLNERS
jgi:hypothetical protein